MKKAFTLSEVLITLSIVGVVAVLTIPSVVKNYRNRLYVAQLQKVTAQIENAAKQMMNDEHVDNFLETKVLSTDVDGAGTTGWQYFLKTYFKTAKIGCTKGTDKTACFATTYRNINGTVVQSTNVGGNKCIQTTNGAAFCINYNLANLTPSIIIDVNGTAEPNITGRDVFVVEIKGDGSVYGPGSADQCNSLTSGWDEGIFAYSVGCYTNIVDAGWKMAY